MKLIHRLENTWEDITDWAGCHILEIALIGVITAYIGGGVYFEFRGVKKENLRDQIRIIANYNKDNIVDRTEWAKVYQDLGLIYDTEKPRDLTIKEMKKYLSTHK